MDYIDIYGKSKLNGTVKISGSKNAALPILAASLLTEGKSVIHNVPGVCDVLTMIKIIKSLGVAIEFDSGTVIITPGKFKKYKALYKYVSTMRASICLLGPLLTKKYRAEVSFPGGCVIGPRPIDLHLKALRKMGAKLKLDKGYIVAEGSKLRGAHIYLGGHFGSSVLATANTVMTATLAKGRTIIENAAAEPEIIDLIHYLRKMGAKISGEHSHTIIIDGVKELGGAEHEIISDRIEAGTYILASAITGDTFYIQNVAREHLSSLEDILLMMGIKISVNGNGLYVNRSRALLRSADITTLPYPGFPTDLQAQMMTLLSLSDGIGVITEKIFPERFMHISELNRMGSNIKLEGSCAIIKGNSKFTGAQVMASDLRASAALMLAALAAKGKTSIHRVYHLDRGYEKMEWKLAQLGAKIKRKKE